MAVSSIATARPAVRDGGLAAASTCRPVDARRSDARHDAAFAAAGQLRNIAGADLLVEVNTTGSLAADVQIRLTATSLTSINAGHFIL